MVHNRDPTKNCENILIEHTPKTFFKASFGLKKLSISLFSTPKTIIKIPWYKKPSYMVSIFFMLKIPPFLHLLLSCIYSLHKVENKNIYYWRFFKMPLPRSVIFLKIRFLKELEDMSLNSLHKDQEAIRNPVVHVRKMET